MGLMFELVNVISACFMQHRAITQLVIKEIALMFELIRELMGLYHPTKFSPCLVIIHQLFDASRMAIV